MPAPRILRELADQDSEHRLIAVRPAGASGPPTHYALSIETTLDRVAAYLRWARLPREMVAWMMVNGRRRWIKEIGPINDGRHDLDSMLDQYDLEEVAL